MIAKRSSHNSVTLPNSVIAEFSGAEYFEIGIEDGRIVLTPVQATCADEVRAQVAERGVTEGDVADAVKKERQDSQDSKAVWVRTAETALTIRTEVDADGVVSVRGLPLAKGERVEVVIKRLRRLPENSERYPLRGLPYKYDSPFEPAVPADEWAALK